MGERVGDIDSCYREVIMIVCQVNQELELPTARYAKMILEQSKTRMEGLVGKSNYRNIAQKTVGLFVQHYLLDAIIAVKRSRPLVVRTSNTATWNVVIKAIRIKRGKKLELGKAIKRRTQLYISGLHHIIRSLTSANIAIRKAIQSGLTYHRTTTEKEMTGSISANHAILYTMANSTRTLDVINKYTDVIRKRYAKFTNNNELPENWEDLTPAVKEQ